MNISNFGLLNAMCSVINADEDTVDRSIARYLVTHIKRIEEVTVNELIDEASVARSSVRRFCNRLGYNCWNDLKASFCDTVYPSDLSHRDLSIPASAYKEQLDECIVGMFRSLSDHVDIRDVEHLVHEMRRFGRVEILCANNTQGNLLRFQQEMFFAGVCLPLLSWQNIEIGHSDEENRLVLVVSVSGRYVDEAVHVIRSIRGRKALVTVCRDERYLELFDEVMYLDESSHELDPYGMYSKYAVTYFFDLVSACYLNLYGRA